MQFYLKILLILLSANYCFGEDYDYWKLKTKVKKPNRHNSQSQEYHDLKNTVKSYKAEPKRVVIVYTSPGCRPCLKIRSDADNGLFPFEVISRPYEEAPFEIKTVPVAHWQDLNGVWRRWPNSNATEEERKYTHEKLVAVWEKADTTPPIERRSSSAVICNCQINGVCTCGNTCNCNTSKVSK